jgi:hypothetical protein
LRPISLVFRAVVWEHCSAVLCTSASSLKRSFQAVELFLLRIPSVSDASVLRPT